MKEKRKDLISTKQKKLVSQLLTQLQAEHPSFYYLSTSDVAHEIVRFAQEPGVLSLEERGYFSSLSARDVQMIMSLHH